MSSANTLDAKMQLRALSYQAACYSHVLASLSACQEAKADCQSADSMGPYKKLIFPIECGSRLLVASDG